MSAAAIKLEARGLIARRGGRTIVDVPELTVRTGETLVLVGPNGAGKTTLVLHLALLEQPDEGDILVDGVSARGRVLQARRRMAVVFQEALLLDRSVQANVEAGMRLRGVSGRERTDRARRWMERFGVGQLARRSSRTLSGGEAQRVSLARAFALEPEVLLLDEPFSALDTPTRAAITDDLASALAETKTTTVVVTHDHDEAARLADRVGVMIAGQIRQLAAPEIVFGSPVDEEVASFVGVETIVPAEVTGRGDGLVVVRAGRHAIEAVDPGGRFARALVCLRPEDVSLGMETDATAQGSVRNRLPGVVRQIARTGGDARVVVDCGFAVTARITRRSLDEMGLAEGSAVVVTFKATAVHLVVHG